MAKPDQLPKITIPFLKRELSIYGPKDHGEVCDGELLFAAEN